MFAASTWASTSGCRGGVGSRSLATGVATSRANAAAAAVHQIAAAFNT